jgi:hypothetical protein
MRRIQWARFMNVPVTFTPDEALQLVYIATAEDFDTIETDGAFWATHAPFIYPRGEFMAPAHWWGKLTYDAEEKLWTKN